MLKGVIIDDVKLVSVKKCLTQFPDDIDMQKQFFHEQTGLGKSSYFVYKKKYVEALGLIQLSALDIPRTTGQPQREQI